MMYVSFTSDKCEVLGNGCTEREKSRDILGHLHLHEVRGSPIGRHIASVGAERNPDLVSLRSFGNRDHASPSAILVDLMEGHSDRAVGVGGGKTGASGSSELLGYVVVPTDSALSSQACSI
jgi:hypothetical protein